MSSKDGRTLWKWFEDVGVARTTGYYHIKKYLDELVGMGILKIERTPRHKRIYVLDEQRLEEFLVRKGIYLPARSG